MPIQFGKKTNIVILALIFLVATAYSFILANKRFENFEYGKFDLGNMSQMVWNTSRGHFMEVTDQFGTNMPRWGMSHIDPIVAIFAPIYWFYADPMVLVLAQQMIILSAIFPLFALIKWKSKSVLAAYLIVLSYIVYPAIGFTLVWTGFHGISFVAPLLIWLVWFLERNDFLVKSNFKKNFIYWTLIIAMLAGKEEIGALLAIGSIFLYFKNKPLAIKTFIVSLVWTLLCFLVFIPHYSHYRTDSVNTFFEQVGVNTSEAANISGENFFINRYAYLGHSYGEIAKNAILKPQLVYKKTFTEQKLEALNNLFGPLGYVVIFSPVWLMSLPDLLIVILSEEEIFDISNHRIAFVIVTLFLSLVYLFQFLKNQQVKKFPDFKYMNLVFVLISSAILFSSLYFSNKTNNPLYVSGKSFIEGKIVSKIFAAEPAIGTTRVSRVPRNESECLNEMVKIINRENPEIYTGPDYLGAQAANRRVNALFPSRFWDADLVIADVFEAKTLGAFGDSGWIFNKEGLRRMMAMKEFRPVYSCGKVTAFTRSGANEDAAGFVDAADMAKYKSYPISTRKISMDFRLVYLPDVYVKNNPAPFVISAAVLEGTFKDKVGYWIFEEYDNPSNKLEFVDYASVGYPESFDKAEQNQYVQETLYPALGPLKNGKYKVYWGMGDLLDASDVYLGTIQIVDDF
jgi:uncharacterized membrane protein